MYILVVIKRTTGLSSINIDKNIKYKIKYNLQELPNYTN